MARMGGLRQKSRPCPLRFSRHFGRSRLAGKRFKQHLHAVLHEMRQVNLVKPNRITSDRKIDCKDLRPTSIYSIWWRLHTSCWSKSCSIAAWRASVLPQQIAGGKALLEQKNMQHVCSMLSIQMGTSLPWTIHNATTMSSRQRLVKRWLCWDYRTLSLAHSNFIGNTKFDTLIGTASSTRSRCGPLQESLKETASVPCPWHAL